MDAAVEALVEEMSRARQADAGQAFSSREQGSPDTPNTAPVDRADDAAEPSRDAWPTSDSGRVDEAAAANGVPSQDGQRGPEGNGAPQRAKRAGPSDRGPFPNRPCPCGSKKKYKQCCGAAGASSWPLTHDCL